MRAVVGLLILGLLAGPAHARSHGYHSALTHHVGRVRESQLVTHGHYVNVSGHLVHRPSHSYGSHAPAGASAHCADGSWSFSEHRQGTCSHHGGVAAWR